MPGHLLQLTTKEEKAEEFARERRNTILNIQKEEGTLAWFGIRMNETGFSTLDLLIDEEARQIHKKDGMERINNLLPLVVESSVTIKEIDIISYKFDGK